MEEISYTRIVLISTGPSCHHYFVVVVNFFTCEMGPGVSTLPGHVVRAVWDEFTCQASSTRVIFSQWGM